MRRDWRGGSRGRGMGVTTYRDLQAFVLEAIDLIEMCFELRGDARRQARHVLGAIDQQQGLVFEAPDLIVDLCQRARSSEDVLAVVRGIEHDSLGVRRTR